MSAPVSLEPALRFPLDGVLHQIAMQLDILRLRGGVAPSAQRIVRLVGAGPIRFGFFHDAAQALKNFALRVDQAENSRVERNPTHVFEPGDADTLEVAFQIPREASAGFGD